jgi:Protein kinase domain
MRMDRNLDEEDFERPFIVTRTDVMKLTFSVDRQSDGNDSTSHEGSEGEGSSSSTRIPMKISTEQLDGYPEGVPLGLACLLSILHGTDNDNDNDKDKDKAAQIVRIGVDGRPTLSNKWATSDFELKPNALGSGGFADVYILQKKTPASDEDMYYAVKHLRDANDQDHLQAEVGILRLLGNKSPHIIELVDTVMSSVMMTQDSISALILRPVGTPCDHLVIEETDVVVGFVKDVLAALTCVHNEGYCHCDVRPSNIIHVEGTGFVLIDFGLAAPFETERLGLCGVSDFLPDEILTASTSSKKYRVSAQHDFASLAYTLLALMFAQRGCCPWHTKRATPAEIMTSRGAWIESELGLDGADTRDVSDIIKCLLSSSDRSHHQTELSITSILDSITSRKRKRARMQM